MANSGNKKNTKPRLSKAAREELRQLFGDDEKNLYKLDQKLKTGVSAVRSGKMSIEQGRMDIIRDLSQKDAERLIGFVEKEETRVALSLKQASASQNEPLLNLIDFYRGELQSLYYNSSQDADSLIGGNKPLEKEYLPKLDLIIKNIKSDKILAQFKQTVPLLALAEKIKKKLTERTTRVGKLKDAGKRFIKSDIVAGVLAGAATKSPFAALAVFAYKNRPKKNEYARRADLRAKEQDIQDRQTQAQRGGEEAQKQSDKATDKSIARQKRKLGQDVAQSKNTAATVSSNANNDTVSTADASDLAVAGGAGAAAGLGGEDTGQIVKILNQHTGLLVKIYGVNAKSLKIQEDQIAKQAAAAEEAGLETQDATASKTSGEPGEEEDDDKKGGMLSSIINLASNFMGGKLGGIAKLFARGGAKGLVSRLGKGALAKVGASRIGQTATSLGSRAMSIGGSALGKTTATATKLGGEVASVATKAAGAGKGALTAFIKKVVPKQVGKLAAKSVPFLGAGLAAGFAVWKLLKGDAKGAALEAAAAIPGAGILAAIASMARDIYHDFYGVQPEEDPEAGARFTEVKEEVQNTANETLESLGLKGKKDNEQKEKKAEQQDATNQQKADQADQKATGGKSPTPSASPDNAAPSNAPGEPGGGKSPTPSASPDNAAPSNAPGEPGGGKPPATESKPSFLNRLFKGAARASLALATGGLSEVFRKFTTDTATPEGGRSGGAGASGNWNGDPTQVLEFGGESGQLQNFKGLHPAIQTKVIQAGQDYFQKTGKKLKVNSAKRDAAKQQQLWDESVKAGRPGRGPNGMAIAKPGRSRHERGLAIDIQNYRDPIAVAALNKQGLFQGVPGDPVHFQLDGNPSLDQLASLSDTGVAPTTSAGIASPTMAGTPTTPIAPTTPAATGPSTAVSAGDSTAQGRNAISGSLTTPAVPMSGGSGGITNIVQGGNTMMGGGGGSSAAQIIPAPIDREPTIRRILDGSLS